MAKAEEKTTKKKTASQTVKKKAEEQPAAPAPKRIIKVAAKAPADDKSVVAKKKVVVKKKIVLVNKDKAETANAKSRAPMKPATQTAPRSPQHGARPYGGGGGGRPSPGGAPPGEKGKDGVKPGQTSGHHGKKKDYQGKRDYKDRERDGNESRAFARMAQKKRQQDEQTERFASVPKTVDIMETISVGDLAKKMHLRASDLLQKFVAQGMMVRVNDIIDADTATIIADDFNCKVNVISLHEEAKLEIEEDKAEDLFPRAPVVTIMGHVDHGKTTILDAIRTSRVVDQESGGITQNIGAYKVTTPKGEIAFIDTPGHEAFTMMRSRGAKATDIVVLVVAADDGVMPQTIEAINHAKAAEAPIIVAVNKMDLPQANPEPVKAQLSQHGLTPEEWGGETLFVYVSALKNEGIDTLLESILLQAEILELKANPKRHAIGTVLESSLDVGRGPVGTVLVQNGTLHVGDHFLAGTHLGKVRAMFDDRGAKVDEAAPSTPVEVLGFETTPEAGELFNVLEPEKAKELSEKRKHLKQIEASASGPKVTLDNLFDQIKEGEKKEFKVIIKADVQGSVEALRESLNKISTEKIRFTVIHGAPGVINESDIMLGDTSSALIIAYRVRALPKAKQLAEKLNVEIKRYDIIYEAIEDIQRAMVGMLDSVKEEVETGTIEIREVFKVSKVGNIGGGYVTSGKVERSNKVRVMREGVFVYGGNIASLKRFKEDAKEVAQGYECGIMVENFNDLKVGDVIEAYVVKEKEDTL